MKIRQETPQDFAAISQVNDQAFGQNAEGKLVSALRNDPQYIAELSFVAENNEGIVGHILLTPIHIKNAQYSYPSLALAPMSVLPQYQRSGVGTSLIMHAVDAAKNSGYSSIIVLGHPAYYSRFGFRPACQWKISCPFTVPDEAFMALELEEGALSDVSGRVKYMAAFSEL